MLIAKHSCVAEGQKQISFAFTSNYLLVAESCAELSKILHIYVKFLCTYWQMPFQNICAVYKILYMSCYIFFSCILNVWKTSDIAVFIYIYTHIYKHHIYIYLFIIVRLVYAYCLFAFFNMYYSLIIDDQISTEDIKIFLVV